MLLKQAFVLTDANADGQVEGTGIDSDGLVTGGDAATVPQQIQTVLELQTIWRQV